MRFVSTRLVSARFAVSFAALLLALPALAQQPGIPALETPGNAPGGNTSGGNASGRPASPVLEAAQAAFEALPEAERKQIQDDLIWAASFTATVSGQHGPRTHAAILQFQRLQKARETGILDAVQRQALKDVATRAKAAARLTIQADPRTGASLPVPGVLFTKRETLPTGTRWESADARVVLETGVGKGGADELPAAFERFVTLQAPGRRVTYKLLRPDFFVVAGEITDRSFYVRYAVGPNNLRGYALSYPTARAKELERFVIAIANGFSAVPALPAQPPAPPPAVAGGPPVPVASTGANAPGGTSPVATAPAPAGPSLPAGHFLTGLVVAPGKVRTAALAAACPELRLNGKPARLVKSGSATTPAEIDGDTGHQKPASLAIATSRPDDAVVILGYGGGSRPALNISTGFIGASSSGLTIAAPLSADGGGSLALDRQGRLIGMLAAPRHSRLVAGFAPAMSHPALAAAGVLPGAGVTAGIPATLSIGDIVAAVQPSLVAIACAQPVPLPNP